MESENLDELKYRPRTKGNKTEFIATFYHSDSFTFDKPTMTSFVDYLKSFDPGRAQRLELLLYNKAEEDDKTFIEECG